MLLASNFSLQKCIYNEHHEGSIDSLNTDGCHEVSLIHNVLHVNPKEEVGVQV